MTYVSCNQIIIRPKVQLVFTGNPVVMSCISRSQPIWRRNENEKFSYNILHPYDGIEETIILFEVHPSETGTYHCLTKIFPSDGFTSHLYVGGGKILTQNYFEKPSFFSMKSVIFYEVIGN